MLSSGVRNLGKLIVGWCAAFGLGAVMLIHFEDIRTGLGLKLNPEDFGISSDARESQAEERVAVRTVEVPVEQPSRSGERRPSGQRGRNTETELFKQSVQLQRGYGGHFHADASINGRTIPVLVDTGATLVALSYEDAQAAGISVAAGDFRYVSQTANGQAKFARVTLDQVRIGNVSVRNVAAAVSQPGRLGTTLLGMSFLGQLRMEMKDGVLVLEQ